MQERAMSSNQDELAAVVSTLRSDCGACDGCIKLLCPSAAAGAATSCAGFSDASRPTPHRDEGGNGRESGTGDAPPCRICLGIVSDVVSVPSSSSDGPGHLMGPILDASKPYGGLGSGGGNFTTRESPTVSIPAALMVRAYCATCAVECALLQSRTDGADNRSVDVRSLLKSPAEYYDSAKELVRSSVRRELAGARKHDEEEKQEVESKSAVKWSREMHGEEAGYLGVHLLLVPTPSSGGDLFPPSTILPLKTDRKRERKRFRGNDPTNKQGGDPKENLMKRIRSRMAMGGTDGVVWNLDRNAVQRSLDGAGRDCAGGDETNARREALAGWIRGTATPHSGSIAYSVHAAVWRRPFYVGGRYTKSRRDVSQTPFYVPDGPGKAMVKKGITSVEEEICPILASVGCGGISKNNNEEDTAEVDGLPTQKTDGGARQPPGKVVYGMCKFHASGREDMDVRMLLSAAPGKEENETGGRPFVCEVIDAHRIPNVDDLTRVVSTINGTCGSGSGANETDGGEVCSDEVTDIVEDAGLNIADVPQKAQTAVVRQYGRNPRGVGVSSLSYCPSSAFKNLQSETENKVKHYGCVCWSERAILSQEQLEADLGATAGGQEDDSQICCPLTIRQSTPLRVLHRRSAAVRVRHVLTLMARRIDKHWFALHLSTSAGTYVKEFVHGDCGRTAPSISSMLGGKTDIMALDCEGIAIQ